MTINLNVDEQLVSVLPEAAAYGVGVEKFGSAIFYGGNNPLIDVEAGDMAIDAKRAFIHQVRGVDGRKSPHIGFMGARGAGREVRDGVTHYALVVLFLGDESIAVGIDVAQGRLTLSGDNRYAIYMVPADVINSRFTHGHRLDGVLRTGKNIYLPLDEAQAFHVGGVRADGEGNFIE